VKDEIKMIPIDRIRILNPRHRDRKKFEVIVQSIKDLGLKKPIQVSLRSAQEAEEPGYDLVCGQGRIEAFIALGHKEIPAVVVEVSKEERLLRSLIENMARRFPTPLALIREIERLKAAGYNNGEIGEKLGMAGTTIGGFIALKNAGEERLLDAATSGRIPLGVAMDIAKTNNVETQRELLRAYESKQLNQASIRTVKRLIDQRRFIGKQRDPNSRLSRNRLTSAESLVNAYLPLNSTPSRQLAHSLYAEINESNRSFRTFQSGKQVVSNRKNLPLWPWTRRWQSSWIMT